MRTRRPSTEQNFPLCYIRVRRSREEWCFCQALPSILHRYPIHTTPLGQVPAIPTLMLDHRGYMAKVRNRMWRGRCLQRPLCLQNRPQSSSAQNEISSPVAFKCLHMSLESSAFLRRNQPPQRRLRRGSNCSSIPRCRPQQLAPDPC
jgi:hypothetical protein